MPRYLSWRGICVTTLEQGMPELSVIVTSASPQRPAHVQEGRVSVSSCSD